MFSGWESLGEYLDSYTYRQSQEKFSDSIQRALADQAVLIGEAGTGTGKTIAYLIPLLLYAVETESRVAVSTDTKSLQTQLLTKDIPLVESILGLSPGAELCLGASNYICKRKMKTAVDQGGLLLAGSELDSLIAWEEETLSGIRSEYPGSVGESVWGAVTRETDNCLGRRCPNYQESYYFVAREKWKKARILVVNHALLASHMALEGKLLPEFSAVVVDEAHKFPDAALDAMKQRLILGELSHLIRSSKRRADRILQTIESYRQEVEGKYRNAQRIRTPAGTSSGHRLIEQIERIEEELREEIQEKENPDNEGDLKAQMLLGRLGDARRVMERFEEGPDTDHVHWVTVEGQKGVIMHRSPLDAQAFIRSELVEKHSSVIFTSATLGASGKKPFSYFARETGCDHTEKEVRYARVGSPFDYEKRTLLFLPPDIVEPSDEDRFPRDCAYWIDRMVGLTGGGAFILFTSRLMLSRVHALLEAKESGISYISQVSLGPPAALRAFHENPDSVLLGLSSFWQGIDVPGDALRLVVIVRLPFQVPDDPVLSARTEKLQNAGRSPFSEIQLPHAVLTVKQGFGRLMRRESDRGIVSILDARLRTKSYGKDVLAALPRARMVSSFEDLQKSYQELFSDIQNVAEIPGRPILNR